MFAPAIGIDTRLDHDIGAVMGGDDRARGVAQINRLRQGLFVRTDPRIGIGLDVDSVEPIRWIGRSPATMDRERNGHRHNSRTMFG